MVLDHLLLKFTPAASCPLASRWDWKYMCFSHSVWIYSMRPCFDFSLGSYCWSPAMWLGLLNKNLPTLSVFCFPLAVFYFIIWKWLDLLPCIVVSISLLLLQGNWSEGWVDENRISEEMMWVLWLKSTRIEKYRCRHLKTMWHNQFPFRQIGRMNQDEYTLKLSNDLSLSLSGLFSEAEVLTRFSVFWTLQAKLTPVVINRYC